MGMTRDRNREFMNQNENEHRIENYSCLAVCFEKWQRKCTHAAMKGLKGKVGLLFKSCDNNFVFFFYLNCIKMLYLYEMLALNGQ